MATAMGVGSSLTSGKALSSGTLRRLFGLSADEDALCFVNIGHVSEARKLRPRPQVEVYYKRLTETLPAAP